MKTTYVTNSIELSENGSVVIHSECGEVATVHNERERFDLGVIQRIKDAVKIAHVLDCVPFNMSDEVAAIYSLTNYEDDASKYYDFDDAFFAWSTDHNYQRVRTDFANRAEMNEEAEIELAEIGETIFGPDAAIIPLEDGTYSVTQWNGRFSIISDVGDALAIAGLYGVPIEEYVHIVDGEDLSLPIAKSCSKCHEVKPLDAFYKQKDGKYGRRADCIECKKASVKGPQQPFDDEMFTGEEAEEIPFDNVVDIFAGRR